MLQEGIIDKNVKFTPVLEGFRMPEYFDWELQPFTHHKVYLHVVYMFLFDVVLCLQLGQEWCLCQHATCYYVDGSCHMCVYICIPLYY